MCIKGVFVDDLPIKEIGWGVIVRTVWYLFFILFLYNTSIIIIVFAAYL